MDTSNAEELRDGIHEERKICLGDSKSAYIAVLFFIPLVWIAELMPCVRIRLTNGAAVRLTGRLVPSPGSGQDKELLVDLGKAGSQGVIPQGKVEVLGTCDPEVRYFFPVVHLDPKCAKDVFFFKAMKNFRPFLRLLFITS